MLDDGKLFLFAKFGVNLWRQVNSGREDPAELNMEANLALDGLMFHRISNSIFGYIANTKNPE